jgi:hypothetical protein
MLVADRELPGLIEASVWMVSWSGADLATFGAMPEVTV